jgi:hypothetical protein
MDTIKVVLFEDPTSLYVVLGVVELFFAVMWFKRRTRAWAMRWAITVAVGLAVFGLAALVVTDREYVIDAMHEIADDCEAGSVQGVGKYLDADAVLDLPEPYGGVELSRAKAMVAIRLALKALNIKDVRYTVLTVAFHGEKANVHAATLVGLGAGGKEGAGTVPLTWDIDWARTPDGWRITRVHRPEYRVELTKGR